MTQRGELVVLVDPDGQPVGTQEKSTVHTTDTPLHLAFSTHVFNRAGQLLVTRRALGKLTWPGVWTNSFCGHPGPGEATADAVLRRADRELGLALRKTKSARSTPPSPTPIRCRRPMRSWTGTGSIRSSWPIPWLWHRGPSVRGWCCSCPCCIP
jgi:hypothetical protein